MKLIRMRQLNAQQWLSIKLIESQSEAEVLTHIYGFKVKGGTFMEICTQSHIDGGKTRLNKGVIEGMQNNEMQ